MDGGTKGPRKSVDSPPPPQKSRLSLWEAAKFYFSPRSGCFADLQVDYIHTLKFLLDADILTLDDCMLRSDESFKQSWETRSMAPVSYQFLYRVYEFTPSEKLEAEQYLSDAAESEYFDIPDPKTRPSFMSCGPFEVYPEGQPQKDPIFEKEPNFLIKLPPLVSKLGPAAVQFHNILTGSNLRFSKVEKANLGIWMYFQCYFITLEAFDDNLSGKKVTCRSRAVCYNRNNRTTNIDAHTLRVKTTFVESFHMVG